MLGKVEICGVNTTKLPTLTAAETDALLHRAKDGDAAAREKLVEGNLRLVLSVIQRFSGRGENADDLFQVGCVGLLKAIDNFDTSQNVRFSTYGVPMIIGEIRRYLRDNSSIRVSRSMRDTAYRVLQAREKLQREQQREPTVEQIARELGIRREEVVFAMDAVCDPVSLFEPIYSDGGENTCGSIFDNDKMGIGVGLWNHERQDAEYFFKELGFDFIKIDFCGGTKRGNAAKVDMDAKERYTLIRKTFD